MVVFRGELRNSQITKSKIDLGGLQPGTKYIKCARKSIVSRTGRRKVTGSSVKETKIQY